MDGYTGRRGVDRLVVPKRGSRLASRDCTKINDQNIQLCNRIGCSGRLNPATTLRDVSLDKTKVLRPSFKCSAPGKEMTANRAKAVAKVENAVKPLRALRNNSPSETGSCSSRSHISSVVKEAEVATSNRSSPALLDRRKSQSGGESTSMVIGSRSVGPSVRPKRTFLKKPASVVDSNLADSRASGASRSTPQLSRQKDSTTRPGSRYLGYHSAPVIATSDPASSTRKQLLKKTSSEGESSSSSIAKQPIKAENTRTPCSRSGISMSETRQARRSQTSFIDNVSALVRASRSDASTSRRPPQMSQHESPSDQRMRRLPNSLSATGHPHRARSFTRPNSSESSLSRNVTSPSEIAGSSTLTVREGFRHYNISGIAEVLLALDQIEHDEEISFEQLLALESNIFLSSLNLQDQHRDMRLDIDGMSYEELLALEERMGSVSTALSNEALAKSIHKSTYKPKSLHSDTNRSDDDTKCSICQEEYDIGDEMGRLQCKHSYHVGCIDQWLRQKNMCPICKSSAFPSS